MDGRMFKVKKFDITWFAATFELDGCALQDSNSLTRNILRQSFFLTPALPSANVWCIETIIVCSGWIKLPLQILFSVGPERNEKEWLQQRWGAGLGGGALSTINNGKTFDVHTTNNTMSYMMIKCFLFAFHFYFCKHTSYAHSKFMWKQIESWMQSLLVVVADGCYG